MSKKNYAGIPDKYARLDDAKVVLIPVPYDGTSTWQKGADKGPDAFLDASENMELFDIETRTEVYKKGVYLAPPVTEDSSPEKMVEAVYKTTKNYLKQEKFVTLFGGEHSISIGTIRAFNETFEDLTVVQLDAHADLRPEYEGSTCNHACAVHEASKNTNLIQVGIRSMDVSELDHMDENQVYFAHNLYEDWMDDAIGQMTPNVFITIDLDVFDPSIAPSTGTPEPGGMFWYETLEFIKMMFKKKNVVGFDIVELNPNEKEKSTDFLAAKLYYKMLSYKFKYLNYNEEDEEDE
ncbi:agmatinase [Salinimicrobium gaetbulicola]|uniref:Agmatinase n=1 Tax=Salinimicrobium gaetbulicola TaxID=999702 RepID=A0ABW3IIC3_9FLAO